MISSIVGAASPYAVRLGMDAVSNSTYGTEVNDADRAAAAAADPAVGHGPTLRERSRCQVSAAPLTGNSHTEAASEFSVYAVVAVAPASWHWMAARAWKADG
jgi:hypothetical protein